MSTGNYKSKKVVNGVITGFLLGIFTLVTLCALLVALLITAGPAYTTKNTKNYEKIYEKRIRSGLIVFPDEITEEMSDIEFSFYFKDMWEEPTASIFLQCTYTQEAYEAELMRLENTKKVYGGTVRRLLRDEGDRYPYKAYIAVDNHHEQYEYALLTGERQITYVHTSYFEREDVRFGQEYLPVDYGMKVEDYMYDGYSIYIKKTFSDGISYDNTKYENVTVKDGHIIWIEDSMFTVHVQLDEQNREIITDCEFSYYEPPADLNDVFTYDEESDDTFFTDLEGYEYVDVTLNEDRTTAIVTYLDEGVEKEWQMELTQYMKVKEQ